MSGGNRQTRGAASTIAALCRYGMVLAGCLFILPLQAAPADTVQVLYQDVYEALTTMQLDGMQVAEVRQLRLKRDAGVFTLKEGQLILCKPLLGRIHAAFFSGSGSFSMQAPLLVEREQLRRVTGKETVQQEFRQAFFFFADETAAELQQKLTFSSASLPRTAAKEVEYCLNYLWQPKKKRFDYAFLRTLLNDPQNGLFYAHFSRNSREPWFFEINPYEDEEVRFSRRLEQASFLYLREIISQFHRGEEYRDGEMEVLPGEKSALLISDYHMDCRLEGNRADFSAVADMGFTLLKPGQNWLNLFLYHELQIDSAFWDTGEPAEVVKQKDNAAIWVRLDRLTPPGEPRRLTLHYHGDLIERQKDWFYIQSSRGWYPRHDFQQRARFEVRYRLPDKFRFASFGQLVSDTTVDKVRTSRWVSERPERNASFNLGFFTEHRIGGDSLFPITVMMAETGHRDIAQRWGRTGVGSGRNMEEQVGEDISRSVEFFRARFGELPVNHLYATDIPFGHGEAFPGLLHLTWLTFQNTSERGDDEIFRAHEVAHQWWGIGVDIATYHDQWLSEGFAEYSGWLYYQHVLREEEEDPQKFYEVLKNWRERIANNRSFFFGDGQEAAPIWLGARVHSAATKGDYTLIIYKKGAWVLHMINSMLLDPAKPQQEPLSELMGRFYAQHLDGNVSTGAFRTFLEEQTGRDWGWFFRQWIYGTSIPAYRCAWKSEQNASGDWQISGRIRQEEVDPAFRASMLVAVEYENQPATVQRIDISGTETVFTISCANQPQKMLFNYNESVLCKLKTDKW